MYRSIRKIAVLLAYFLAVWLSVRFFLPVSLPFLLGGALALAAEPMVKFLARRMPRALAAGIGVTAALCFLGLAFLLVLALILREISLLSGMLPELAEVAESSLSALSVLFLRLIGRLPENIREVLGDGISEFFSGSSQLLGNAFRYAFSLTGGLLRHLPEAALVIGTAVISGYMISGQLPRLRSRIAERIPRERLRRLLDSLKGMKSALTGWLKAQLQLMGITWLILTMTFILLRIPYAPLWAALVSLVDAFPVLGTGTVLLPWSLVCFLQQDTGRAVGLLGCYGIIVLGRSILEPRLLGSHLGLDPLAALGAIYAGYRLWGLWGMILAPALAVMALELIRSGPKTEG